MAIDHRPDPTSVDQRTAVVALSVALLIYASIVQLVPGYTALYVPISLVGTGLLLIVARWLRLDRRDLAITPDRVADGLRWGGVIGLVAATGLAVGVAVPALRPLLEDDRVGDIGYGLLAYRMFIRIPLGTALLEEVAFRGVLFGAWQRWAGTRAAIVGSSVVFGLWHVRPAWDLLDENGVSQPVAVELLLVATAVMLTAAAGGFFCWLRTRSRSLVAPFVAHAMINSVATLAAFAAFRL